MASYLCPGADAYPVRLRNLAGAMQRVRMWLAVGPDALFQGAGQLGLM